MAEHVSVDRVEGRIAVCERADGTWFEIALEELSESVREGDCLLLADGSYTVDSEETERRRKANRDLFTGLLGN